MEQCRQGKSAKRIRNFGKRIGSEGWARGSRPRTRRLPADCSSCSAARERVAACRPGDGPGTAPSGAFPGPKPQPRERAWQNQRGKKTLLSLTLVRLCEMT
ncbi:hypothetical protein LUZ60_017844 [Juncus effusus]|nr:hypothetical protein LUZ60_017844 [Juncus effusus]